MEVNLPGIAIYPFLRPIIELISTNDLVSVSAKDGYGRGIGIPWILAKSKLSVLVACESDRVSRLIRYLSSVTEDITATDVIPSSISKSTIIYMSQKNVAHLLINDGFPKVDVLVLDGGFSVYSSMIAALWNKNAHSTKISPRLVISRNTRSNFLSKLASDSITGNRKIADEANYVCNVPSNRVRVLYHNKSYKYNKAELNRDIARVVLANIPTTLEAPMNILVYLHSDVSITTVKDILQDLTDTKIITSIDPDVVDAQGSNILLATQEGAHIFTVRIDMVIDSMMTLSDMCSMSGCRCKYMSLIDKHTAKIRSLRAGWDKVGVCYRMCTKETFLLLDRQIKRRRTGVYAQILEFSNYGINIGGLLYRNRKVIRKETKMLGDMGALDSTGLSTKKGMFMEKCPLSMRHSSVLWDWLEKGYKAYACVALLSMLDCYEPIFFATPEKEVEETISGYQGRVLIHKNTHFSRFRGRSDINTLINVWSSFMEETDGLISSDTDIDKWSDDNSIDRESMKRIVSKIHEVLTYVESSHEYIPIALNTALDRREHIEHFNPDDFVDTVRDVFADSYTDKVLVNVSRSVSRTRYKGVKNNRTYILDDRTTINGLLGNPPKYLLPVIESKVDSGVLTVNVIHVALDIDYNGVKCTIIKR